MMHQNFALKWTPSVGYLGVVEFGEADVSQSQWFSGLVRLTVLHTFAYSQLPTHLI